MTSEFAVALSGESQSRASGQLARDDGQEDVCFALWRPSTGYERTTAVIGDVVIPGPEDRTVRGTAWFTGEYAFRAAKVAASQGAGVALLHSHPGASTWQMTPDGSADAESERRIASVARELTGYPLVGLTLSGRSQTWSGRLWNQRTGSYVRHTEATTVRVLENTLRMSYNPILRPARSPQESQLRTLNSWGEERHSHLARLKVLVVGAGSVGQLILEMLARTGVQHIGIMDFDGVEIINLDRLLGATRLDVLLHTSKVELGNRTIQRAATAQHFMSSLHETSVCEPAGMRAALDYDLIFSCVDRPWPRHVLNTIAYSDVIPVVDGGVRLEPGTHGGFRNAYWRSHVVGSGRTCMRCLRQYDVADVQLDRDGSLDDPTYIAGLPRNSALRTRQNVFATSMAAASAMTNQFLSLVVAPSGFGDPGPMRFDLRQHRVESVQDKCADRCAYRSQADLGDRRLDPTGIHEHGRGVAAARAAARRAWRVRTARLAVRLTSRANRLALAATNQGRRHDKTE